MSAPRAPFPLRLLPTAAAAAAMLGLLFGLPGNAGEVGPKTAALRKAALTVKVHLTAKGEILVSTMPWTLDQLKVLLKIRDRAARKSGTSHRDRSPLNCVIDPDPGVRWGHLEWVACILAETGAGKLHLLLRAPGKEPQAVDWTLPGPDPEAQKAWRKAVRHGKALMLHFGVGDDVAGHADYRCGKLRGAKLDDIGRWVTAARREHASDKEIKLLAATITATAKAKWSRISALCMKLRALQVGMVDFDGDLIPGIGVRNRSPLPAPEDPRAVDLSRAPELVAVRGIPGGGWIREPGAAIGEPPDFGEPPPSK